MTGDLNATGAAASGPLPPAFSQRPISAPEPAAGDERPYPPFFAVENLFDRRYNASVVINAAAGRYYEPAPGRHYLLGVALPIGGWR